jgi:predicted ATPase/DNA-binding CsgD family transcriptional regulator
MAPGGRGKGNLPAELTSFIGRRDETAEVKRLLADYRLVTLTGVGGVGKTRLALRTAADLARAFPDGVWLVQLDQLRDEALVAQAVAGALGVQDQAGASPAASVASYLADCRLLLVLDNCEHLVDAAAKLADQLLRAAPDLWVLATSREALNIAAETVLPVPPLAAPEAGHPLVQAGLFPAVRLFAERAAQAVPGFALTAANQAAVAGICRRLEGLPLALELAAALVRVLSPEQIDERLADRLGLLTRGGRAHPARQQTLRASIEWSYELCSPAEQLLWARLSVFVGGFELDAVEGVCADHLLAARNVLGPLAALADKSVLIAEHGEGVVRYRLPETLREFGQERLQEFGGYTALRCRHRDWHEQLARHTDADLLSPRIAVWVARLYREHANVRAAQDFCQAEPGEAEAEAGLRIALHVWPYYYWHGGYVSEGRYRLGQALARAREPTVWRARGLLLAGLLAAVSGDRGAAQGLLAEGTGLARQLNDPATSAFAASVAGNACLFANDLRQATAYLEDALAALPAAADQARQRAIVLHWLAVTAGLAGDEEQVLARRWELVALTEPGGEFIQRWYCTRSVWALGLAAWRRGGLDRAAGLQQQCLRLLEGLDDRVGNTYCLEALAWIAASGHQYERAAVLLGAADRLLRSMAMTLDGYQPLATCQRDCEGQARQALGEQAFQAARQCGLELTAEDALAYALQPSPDKLPGKPPVPAAPEPGAVLTLTVPGSPQLLAPGVAMLSARERELVALVAHGRTDAQIAAQLYISVRTVRSHLDRIRDKTGCRRRADLTRLALTAGLV